MPDQYPGSLSLERIRSMLREARTANTAINLRVKTRRQLVMRSSDTEMENHTGTFLPPPYDKTQLALKTMIGETAKAVQHYAARIAANTPKVVVEPLSANNRITETVKKLAGDQERCDMQTWTELGGRGAQWEMGMHMTIGGVGYYLILPQDADFGLPDRAFYTNETDEELNLLRDQGKVTPYRVMRPGDVKLVYAEPNDVWAGRRKQARQQRAESGRSLFSLRALPRDQVFVWRDGLGIKAAAILEEVPGSDCMPGEELAMYFARTNGITGEDISRYGIWLDKDGHIIGGIEQGGPPGGAPDSTWHRPNAFTLIRFFDRVNQHVLIAPMNVIEGAEEVWSGKHGCKKQGVPECPVVEVPMMRTGINIPGQEFTTPMEPVFAYAPLVNQQFTLLSNAAGFDLIPRWGIETADGSILRGEDGEPKLLDQGDFVPGLDPSEAVTINGKLKQILIDTKAMQELQQVYLERVDACMPSPITAGQSGSSAAAWQVRQLIQQAQEALRQSVDNHALAVKEVLQRIHGWERDLDVPIYFFPAPGERQSRDSMRSLVEFDPKDLTDSIAVVQELDTPDEATVLLQQGIELYQAGFIDLEEFFEKYAREQDTREAIIRKYMQEIWSYVWTGAEPPLPAGAQPGALSMVKIIGDGVRGQVFYQLIQLAPHYADQVANDMASQAQQQMAQMGVAPGQPTQGSAPGQQPQQQGGNVMEAAGMGVPGMGMAPSLPQQLGSRVPGGMAPPVPAGG